MSTYFDSALLKADTENGKDWLCKYLHPPSSKGQSYNGYPDKSVTPAIHAEYRLAYEGLPVATRPATSNTVLFLHAPGLLNTTFYAESISPSNTDNSWLAALTNDQIDSTSVSQNMARTRLSYLSETIQYDVTAFTNNGMVYGAQFYPTTYTLPLATAIVMIKKHTPDLTPLYASITSMYGKHVTAALVEHVRRTEDPDYADVGDPPSRLNLTGYSIQVVKLGKMVLRPSDITMLSPKSYQARSTEGAFIVHQCSEDTNQWSTTQNFYLNGGESDPAFNQLMLCAYEQTAADGRINIFPFRVTGSNPTPPLNLANYCYDIEWPKWSWAYTMWTGLTNGENVERQLNIKYIGGFEINPQTRSILNSQTMTPAIYDSQAIKTAAVITQSRQDCMPASMNILGDVAEAVVGSIAKPLFGNVIDSISGADGRKGEKKEMKTEVEHKINNSNEATDVVNDSMVNGTIRKDSNGPIGKRFGGYMKEKSQKDYNRSVADARLRNQIKKLRNQIRMMRVRSSSRTRGRSNSRSRGRSNSRSRKPIKPIIKTNKVTIQKKA